MNEQVKQVRFYLYNNKSAQMDKWLEVNKDNIIVIGTNTKNYNSVTKEHIIYFKEK